MTPRSAARACTSGGAVIAVELVVERSSIGFGVPAGATTIVQAPREAGHAGVRDRRHVGRVGEAARAT